MKLSSTFRGFGRLLIIQVILIATALGLVIPLSGQADHVELSVSGACGMCTANIEAASNSVKGVRSASYNLETQMLHVDVKPSVFSLEVLAKAIADVGYDNELFSASLTDYNNLALCCQYRDETEEATTEPTKEFAKSLFLSGKVLQAVEGGFESLIGATVLWKGADVGATTDLDGNFEIGRIAATDNLIISYIGFNNDTIDVSRTNNVHHVMNTNTVMDEVVITHKKKTTSISFIDPIQVSSISEEELCKAACCSLSESFETSPAIDVSFADAVTGTRQIQMLGLAGKYVQISRELIPDVRSISVVHGMEDTPGPWVESIQLSKGVGSVVNGYESMTGQINAELRKPEKVDKFFLNVYGNQGGRYEANVNYNHEFNQNISTGFLLHGSTRQQRMDRNEDGFLDNKLSNSFIGINRWKYQHKNGLQAQFGVKVSQDESQVGSLGYLDQNQSQASWGGQTSKEKVDVWAKIGKVFNKQKNRSVGLQLAYNTHTRDSQIGVKTYNVDHTFLYANALFQTDLVSKQHSLTTGISLLVDDIEEDFIQDISGLMFPINHEFDRIEQTPGIFAEYTFKPNPDWTIVAGLRGDHHNYFGFQASPRLHVRHAIKDGSVIRFVSGIGWRSPNIINDNPRIFANNRRLDFNMTNLPLYGLDKEVSWNSGVNLTQELNLGNRESVLSVDYYYTHFINQIIADYEEYAVQFVNQNGDSYGHSAQAQLDYELFDNFDVRLAYRYNISYANLGGELKETPFNPFHKAFVNLAYETESKWYFDATINWRGKQRLPSADWRGDNVQYEEYTPDYFLVNAQIRKFLSAEFEWYLGVENAFNFTQEDPILGVDEPFTSNFDASLVWAPIFGRNIYVGLRYKLGKS